MNANLCLVFQINLYIQSLSSKGKSKISIPATSSSCMQILYIPVIYCAFSCIDGSLFSQSKM